VAKQLAFHPASLALLPRVLRALGAQTAMYSDQRDLTLRSPDDASSLDSQDSQDSQDYNPVFRKADALMRYVIQRKCVEWLRSAPRVRYFVVNVAIVLPSTNHANALIFDREKLKCVRIEPFGARHFSGAWVAEALRAFVAEVDAAFELVPPPPRSCVQADAERLCVSWALFITVLVLINPELSEADVYRELGRGPEKRVRLDRFLLFLDQVAGPIEGYSGGGGGGAGSSSTTTEYSLLERAYMLEHVFMGSSVDDILRQNLGTLPRRSAWYGVGSALRKRYTEPQLRAVFPWASPRSNDFLVRALEQ
jgi:hypothetical protein